ncbi:uncharacterized protein NPIL_201401 [Nephila pilipes]|uniref:Integrase zinc-binding domain-containing protein n=1 Tax=Nephila pilipes TaxID=299642 RepID=A0A8X6QLX3_NEPPI|nr:uncharacterized protein NPIL_201401 [Nephila pilipes]
MDALKTKRKLLRTSFTATANKLKECLGTKEDSKDGDKLRALNSQLQDKFLRLDEIQNKISSLLLENTDSVSEYETDFQAAEDFRDNFLELKSTIETLLNKDFGSFLESSSEPDVSMVLDSRAAGLLSSFPIVTENYPKAVEQLKLRFGREDLLVQIYVRDLLSLVLKNATTGKNAPDLATLYDMLKTKLRALESLGHTKEKFADFLEPLVESCLPENVLRAWEWSRISESTDDAISQRSLEKLMCFLRHEVESEEMIRLAREGFGKDRGGGAIRKKCQKSAHKDEPTAATLISSTTGAKLYCIFCDLSHLSQDCQKLSDMSYEDRKSQVIRKRCCLVCLKVGHLAKRCHSSVRCLICKRRHYPLFCPDLRKEKERLRNRDKEVCVRALLDDGSQRSCIEKNLTAELFLSPSGREIFSQGLFGGGIFPASEHKRYMIRLRTEDRDVLRFLWWEGPGWLYNDEESWPCSEVSETPDEAFLERRKTVVTNLATGNEVRFGDRFLYFSSYKKILRMTAYVLRFCNNIKRNSSKLVNLLSCEKMQKAEETLIKIMQSEWPSEIRENYKDTIQFSEENGILKVQTRLILSQDQEDFTPPTVLPDHPLLERLFLHTHRSLMHAGVLTTLAQLREKFWIPKGRRVVRAILRQCIKCKRLTAGKVNPNPAPLPPNRIHRVAAFQITGADLAGPLSLREEQRDILRNNEKFDDILDIIQEILSVPSFIFILGYFVSCCVTLTSSLTSREKFSIQLLTLINGVIILISSNVTLWMSEGLPEIINKLKETFYKKTHWKIIFVGTSGEPDLRKEILDKPDFALMGCKILFYRKCSALAVIGMLLTYTLLVVKTPQKENQLV